MYCNDQSTQEHQCLCLKTSCPSGLRSHVKAVVLIGAGSNPADVILPFASFLASVLLKLIAERVSYYVQF